MKGSTRVNTFVAVLLLISIGGCVTFACNPCIDVPNETGKWGAIVWFSSAFLAMAVVLVEALSAGITFLIRWLLRR